MKFSLCKHSFHELLFTIPTHPFTILDPQFPSPFVQSVYALQVALCSRITVYPEQSCEENRFVDANNVAHGLLN